MGIHVMTKLNGLFSKVPLIIVSLSLSLCIHQQDVAEKDFVQLTYTDAVELLLKANKKFEFPVWPTT